MLYTVGEMAKLLSISPSAIRYYDRVGLLPSVQRTKGGTRMFTEEDYEWLLVIHCLKESGLQLNDIREFIQLAVRGDETLEERLALFIRQREIVRQQMADLQGNLEPCLSDVGETPPKILLEDILTRYHAMRKKCPRA